MSSYQKKPFASDECTSAKKRQEENDEVAMEENPLLASGNYGSIQRETPMDIDILRPDDDTSTGTPHRSTRRSLWLVVVGGLVLFVGGISLTGIRTGQPLLLSDWLGAYHHASSQQLLEDPDPQTQAEKKALRKKRKADKRARKDAKKKRRRRRRKFEPTPYPGCTTVFAAYGEDDMSWAEHQAAAESMDCHLASIHSDKENTKLHAAALWEFSSVLDITMSIASGIGLNHTFYLGGSLNYYDESAPFEWEWVDGSDWDYGPSADASGDVPGSYCLISSVSIDESLKDISYIHHWKSNDCETPLPAIYKCCVVHTAPWYTLAPTFAPLLNNETTTAIMLGSSKKTAAAPVDDDEKVVWWDDDDDDDYDDIEEQVTADLLKTPMEGSKKKTKEKHKSKQEKHDPVPSPADPETTAPIVPVTAAPTEKPATPAPTPAPITTQPTPAPSHPPVTAQPTTEPSPAPVTAQPTTPEPTPIVLVATEAPTEKKPKKKEKKSKDKTKKKTQKDEGKPKKKTKKDEKKHKKDGKKNKSKKDQ